MKAVMVDGRYFQNNFPKEKELLAEHGIDLVVENFKDENEYIEKCKDADALLILMEKTPKNVINHLERCKVMVRYGIGFDCIDVKAASEKGIAVCNIPDYCIPEVAAHSVALALGCLRKVTISNNEMRKGKWGEPAGYSMHRLSNLTYGFVGLGNIAKQAAKYVSGFGFRLIGYDPYLSEEVFDANHVEKVSLEELCKTADVISVHVPLSDSTYHLINKKCFDMMKKGVIIINTSRGPLINEEELLDAVDAGIVAAAGLDVQETEPLTDPKARVLQYDTVITTSHIAALTVESLGDLRMKVCQSAIKVLEGELPFNVVNKAELVKNK